MERDLTTIVSLAELHGTDARVVNAWSNNSRYRKDWALKMLHQNVLNINSNPIIAIWGLAYKENTHSIKNSPAIDLIKSLEPYRIQVFDPVVPATVVPLVQGATSVLEAANNADVLIIMTPWSLFREVDIKKLVNCMRGRVIIDPYRVLNRQEVSRTGFSYLTLGIDKLCFNI